MPLYEYKCRECGRQFESYRRLFDALKEETCPSCGGRAERSVISLFRAGGSRADGGGTCGSGTRRSPFG
jgi:putative FmdB family regulatory protein